jgi:hypothetical protein
MAGLLITGPKTSGLTATVVTIETGSIIANSTLWIIRIEIRTGAKPGSTKDPGYFTT